MRTWIAIALLALIVTACGDGGSGGNGSGGQDTSTGPHVACADVANSGQTNCRAVSASHLQPESIVNAGVVTRSDIIEVSIDVDNPLSTSTSVLIGVIFDAGCNGAPTWPLVDPPQQYTILANDTLHFNVGGSCGDMPVGGRTVTGTVYDDSMNELDSVTVNFTLVN